MAWMPEEETELPLRRNSAGQGLILSTLAMLALGVVMVNSALASVARPGQWYSRPDVRDAIFAVMSAIVLGLAWKFDYHRLQTGKRFPVLATVLLAVSIVAAMLVFVPGIGLKVGGFARFIRIGPAKYAIGFQPSELIMYALIIFLAAWLTREDVKIRSFWKTFVPACLVIGVCCGEITREDFSTGAVVAMAAFLTLLLAGVPWYYMLILAPPVGAASWHFLKDPYRWNRILAWLDPWSQSNASAYQARESLVAILTGGWTGKGLGNGMTKLGYLPEDSSDFIFSVFCEEWGFVGSLLLMGLVLMWIWHAWKAAARARDRFGQVLAGSLGFLIAFQAVLHIAVAIVVAPTTGMGLPFISAGGTSLIITVAAAAMIISVSAHRCAAVAGLAGELASAAPPVEPARRIAGMLPAKA